MDNGPCQTYVCYDFYEEMEWRLVYDESSTHFTKNETEGIHRLKIEASDIKVIIFPDEVTKQQSLGDEFIRKYFSEHLPIMSILDECSNF
jgi:hypothetical protein